MLRLIGIGTVTLSAFGKHVATFDPSLRPFLLKIRERILCFRLYLPTIAGLEILASNDSQKGLKMHHWEDENIDNLNFLMKSGHLTTKGENQ
jgi:hypothetical protein